MDYFMNVTNMDILANVVSNCGAPVNVKKGKKPKYYLPIYSGFDIETTNIVDTKHAYMYIWQWSFGEDVIFGRTWYEFCKLLNLIKKVNNLSERVHVVIWVANLSFEFQFMRKYLNVTRIFAKEKRKPLYVEVDGCIEFRDALPISGGNLAHLASNFCKTKKLIGELDYSLVRNASTPLTKKELSYCRNDVVILAEWSKYIFDTFIEKEKYIPLTKTGILRKMVKQKAPSGVNALILDCAPSESEYNIWMKYLFRGGYVHGNAYWVGELVSNVHSVDITSSYPDRMLNSYFPSKFFKTEWDIKYLNTHCCILHVTFHDLQATTNHSIESISKCVNISGGKKIIDNGRIRYAEYVEVWLTELDYLIYEMYYTWSDMEVVDFYASKRIQLPNYLLDVLKTQYIIKHNLKEKKLKDTVEYEVAKRNVNSAYGLLVTRLVNQEILYVNEEWITDGGANYSYIEQIEKNVLLPQWGVWVTAQARYKILKMIKKISDNSDNSWRDDVLYCDTDSIKMVNYETHRQIIDGYNREMIEQNESKYTKHFFDIGTFDYEGCYSRFKTLGSKRYAYEDEKGIHITVAGLPKSATSSILSDANKKNKDFFDIFVNNMTLEVGTIDKLTTCYNDSPHEDIVDGELMHEESSVCLFNIPFKLRMVDIYVALLESIHEERNGKYEDRVY